MRFGIGVSTRGPLADPENLATLARRSEEMGFDIISVSDHIVVPKSIASRYPYNESGEFTGRDPGECMEQLTVLSFLAGVTSTARLLTSVMVLPHRNPVHTAKALATIDVLSEGRLTLGCGVGWMREEFEALGTPPYEERGAVGDEYIRAFKELWTSDSPTFQGRYCSFSDISFLPRPVQRPHPPIWIGGESPPALRRAARLGDTWFPIGSNPRFPVASLEQLTASKARIDRHAQEAGREPSEIGLAYSASWYNDREAQTARDGRRQTFTGTPQQVAGDIKTFEEAGVHSLMLGLTADSLDGTIDRMERFATSVRPLAES